MQVTIMYKALGDHSWDLSFFEKLMRKSLFLKIFVYFWLHWIFIAVCRFSLVAASGGYSTVAVYRLLIAVASCYRAQDLRRMGFSSCGS